MKLVIAIPEKILFEGEAEVVNIPTFAGDISVLSHHVSLVSAVRAGKIKIETADGDKFFNNEDGVIEISENKATILLRGCVEE
jgi:F-type H+-transporting ATPase subunit epsilon